MKIAGIGTWARIIDFGQMPDGLLSIVARGERRFRIVTGDTQKDGLHLGRGRNGSKMCHRSSPRTNTPRCAPRWRAYWPTSPMNIRSGTPQFDDAQWVAGNLAQLMPAPASFRQGVLEADDVRARLDMLESVLAGRD